MVHVNHGTWLTSCQPHSACKICECICTFSVRLWSRNSRRRCSRKILGLRRRFASSLVASSTFIWTLQLSRQQLSGLTCISLSSLMDFMAACRLFLSLCLPVLWHFEFNSKSNVLHFNTKLHSLLEIMVRWFEL